MANSFSENGCNTLCLLENFSSVPYLDALKIPTIGIGTTIYPDGTRVTMNDRPITHDQAIIYMKQYLTSIVNWVNSNCKWNPSQCEFDALCCFLYNTGIGNRFNSYIHTKAAIISGDKPNIIKGMLSIRNGGLLDRRRQIETTLFAQDNPELLTGTEG